MWSNFQPRFFSRSLIMYRSPTCATYRHFPMVHIPSSSTRWSMVIDCSLKLVPEASRIRWRKYCVTAFATQNTMGMLPSVGRRRPHVATKESSSYFCKMADLIPRLETTGLSVERPNMAFKKLPSYCCKMAELIPRLKTVTPSVGPPQMAMEQSSMIGEGVYRVMKWTGVITHR
jgi:hypothetical protein